MTEPTNLPPEPYWVQRMRDAGYTVRVGTDPTPLSVEPEVWFNLPCESHRRRSRPLARIVGRLWNHGSPFKRRLASR